MSERGPADLETWRWSGMTMLWLVYKAPLTLKAILLVGAYNHTRHIEGRA